MEKLIVECIGDALDTYVLDFTASSPPDPGEADWIDEGGNDWIDEGGNPWMEA